MRVPFWHCTQQHATERGVTNVHVRCLTRHGVCCCPQRPPYQLHTLLRKEQLPPLLLMLLLTVLRECMGADTVRLFSRPFWEAVGWTNSRHGFFLEQIENGFYLLGECAAQRLRGLPVEQHCLGSAASSGCHEVAAS
jgi:hypothetical protein